jgi:beta-1,4-mannosyltransferase
MKTALRIGYAPFENSENAYTQSVKNALASFGTVENIPSPKTIVRQRLFRRFDLFVFNWNDNSFIDHEGKLRAGAALRETLRLLVYRLAAKKVLFVRHNVYPHNTSEHSRALVKRVVDFYERCFSLSWVHSGHLATDNRMYVPHPLYLVADGDDPEWQKLQLPEKYFIVFGRLLPYKQIDKLLDILPPDINLVVAGSAPDQAYLEKLRSYKRDNVVLLPQFISDALARKLLANSLGMVLCNADEDMIVSGSMVFSISVGVPVIAIETPFAHWFQAHVNPHMITVASGLPELVEKLRSYSRRVDSDDVQASQSHFSPQKVKNHMLLSFKKLGLL